MTVRIRPMSKVKGFFRTGYKRFAFATKAPKGGVQRSELFRRGMEIERTGLRGILDESPLKVPKAKI